MSVFGPFDPIDSFIDAFRGTYDGDGHAIDRLTIVPAFPADIGLFGATWDTQTSGQPTSSGGVGLSTAQMQMQATFDPPGTSRMSG